MSSSLREHSKESVLCAPLRKEEEKGDRQTSGDGESKGGSHGRALRTPEDTVVHGRSQPQNEKYQMSSLI